MSFYFHAKNKHKAKIIKFDCTLYKGKIGLKKVATEKTENRKKTTMATLHAKIITFIMEAATAKRS